MALQMCLGIQRSVGVGGVNLPADVRAVQELLIDKAPPGAPALSIDGKLTPALMQAIRDFQRRVMGLSNPDGRVDPGGRTLLRLNALPEPRWVRTARGETGVAEIPGARHNPRVVEYLNTCTNIGQQYRDSDETAWCSAFVNWCMLRSGMTGTNHALASSWLDWGTPLTEPRVGAITVIRKRGASSDAATGSTTGNHVGFLVAWGTGTFTLLGGNQGGGVRVQESRYGTGAYMIRGYRWPAGAPAMG
jgi:uncharacterized protein (TIGR02594 family)